MSLASGLFSLEGVRCSSLRVGFHRLPTAEARARAIAQEAEAAALGAMAEAAEATRVAREASMALEEAKASPDLR